MELKPGYKLTEVGLIPEDWDVKPLAYLCRSICDGTHFTPKYVQHGVPFYSVENITANDFTNTKFISESDHVKLIKRCKPERGDILMTRITAGVIGDTRILDWDVNASIYVSLALLKPNDRIVAEYLYRYSKSSAFVRDVEKRALINATPKKINMRDIGAVPIPVPTSSDEQRAIAEALSDVDALLAALDRLIAKQRDLKQATMQQLLTGQTRLPGFTGEWEVKRLGDVVDFLDGRRRPIKDSNRAKMRGDIPYYGASGIVDYVNDYLFDEDLILLGEDGENILSRNSRLAFKISGKTWVNNHAHVLKPKPFMKLDYLVEFLESLDYEQYNTGTAQPKLNKAVCSELPILCPTLSEQIAIAAVLTDMDAELATLEQRRAKTRLLKQAMMQELLTGRTRLVG